MLRALPPAIPGFHWHIFEEERVVLLLIYTNLETALSELDAKIDAWFLDGFAPAKNPEMWSDALYDGMRNLSADGATFAT
jgi:tRNA 5-methylaminomethyl-2-thiouridine biosynthesis bifunctional protein